MAEIININKAIQEKQDEEDGVFVIRDSTGDIKDITDWTADDWELLFECVLIPMSQASNVSIYEFIAKFMNSVLTAGRTDES